MINIKKLLNIKWNVYLIHIFIFVIVIVELKIFNVKKYAIIYTSKIKMLFSQPHYCDLNLKMFSFV